MSQYGSFTAPLVGDHNKGPTLEAVNLVSFSLAAVVVIARLSYRTLKIKQTSWDDYTILLSTVAAVVNTAFIIKYVKSGGGRHSVYLGKKALEAKKWSTVAQIPFIISTTLTKLSIVLMILRISGSRKLKWSMAPVIALVVGVNFAGLIILVAGCRPFEAQWNYTVVNRHCWSRTMMMNQNWMQGMVSILSDFIFTLMPIFVVWGLNISKRQKIAISGLIGLGLVATGCSIARMVIYETFTNWNDTTYGFSDLQIWTALEQNLGILAASLPTLRVFFKELVQAISKYFQPSNERLNSHSRPQVEGRRQSKQESSVEEKTDPEKGFSQWEDSDSGICGKCDASTTMQEDIERLELKYLGGDLDL